MRIGIDAVPFAFEQAGIARYLGNVLEEMRDLAPNVEYLLYSPLPVTVPMKGGDWCLRTAPRGLSQRPTVWVQTVLPSLLASDRVDAFWAQPTNLPISLRRWCFRVLTVHDLVPYVRPESMRLRAWMRMRLMLRPEARAADAVVTDSYATASQAHRYLGIRSSRVRVVYAASAPWCRPVPANEAREVLGREFALSPGYVLCVSTIEPRKDHLTLLRALESVPDAPLLVLAGASGWRSTCILEAIRNHENRGRVKYLGRVDDRLLPVLYSGAMFSVYPSLYEGFGLPLLESMACGCPVLSSDSSSLPEVGGRAARYFRTGDAASLAAEIQGMLGDKPSLDAMSEAGLARAGLFSFRRAAEQLLGIIQEGLRRPHSVA
jgi:glycosyltransferase involved in cell wall biosynthesis